MSGINSRTTAALTPASNGPSDAAPELMTEAELICFLRIPEVSKAMNYHNASDNLKRLHDVPRIHICGQPLYPREAILEWIRGKTTKGNNHV